MGFSLKKFFSNPLSPITEPIKMVSDGFQDVVDTVSGKKARQAAQEQQERELQNWYLQQEYNTPANQVARLTAAGLNPNLFYDQGNPGNATSAPGTVNVPAKGDMSSILGYAFQALPFLFQAQQMSNQAKVQQAGIEHQQDVLNFQKAKFFAEQSFRQEQWDYNKSNMDTYGTKPGSTLDFLVKLLTNTMGKSPTDVATDTHNYLNSAIKLIFWPLSAASSAAGTVKGFAKYGSGTPYERGNVMSKGRYF